MISSSGAAKCLALSAVIGVSFAASGASAQQTMGAYKDVTALPDGYQGEQITQLLDVINANDPERTKTFVQERFTDSFRDFAPMDEHIAQFARLYAVNQGLLFHSVRVYEDPRPDHEIVVIARGKLTGAWRGLVMTIEPTPPHRISSLMFAPARAPSDAQPSKRLSESEIAPELQSYVNQLAKADAFSGTALFAKDGKVLFEGAWGLASKRFNVANNLDTKFNLGSVNKMFTAVAIAQLVERGTLAFDDPLSKHLSTDWLPRETADKIQLRHLLTHTSGLGSYFTEEFMNASRERFRTVDDFRPIVSKETLAFEPGSDWSYSNSAFLLLGAVIESVTGQSYFDYVRENIFKPAGMSDTDSYEMDRPIPNLAIGYTKRPDGWYNNILMHVVRGGPAGGGYSTVRDLLKFDRALRSGKLVNEITFNSLTTPKPELNSPHYGYGFGIHGTQNDRIVGHTGGFPGVSADFKMFLDQGYTVAVLSNYGGAAHAVSERIMELMSNIDSSSE